jgi:hypothetical protein
MYICTAADILPWTYYTNDGVATDPSKTEAMLRCLVPCNFTELRGFLGLTSYYQKCVHHYGTLARPLTNLLQHRTFQWSDST